MTTTTIEATTVSVSFPKSVWGLVKPVHKFGLVWARQSGCDITIGGDRGQVSFADSDRGEFAGRFTSSHDWLKAGQESQVTVADVPASIVLGDIVHVQQASAAELAWLSLAIDNECGRFALGGIGIQATCLVATDGHRLHLIGEAKPERYSILPSHVVDWIVSVKPTTTVQIRTCTRFAQFDFSCKSLGMVTVKCELIAGAYPRVSDVVNKPTLHTGTLCEIKSLASRCKLERLKKAERTGERVADVNDLVELASVVEFVASPELDAVAVVSACLVDLRYLGEAGPGRVYQDKANKAIYVANGNRTAMIMPARR